MASINKTLYVGVTNDLVRRVDEHKMELREGFTKKYKCKKIVYYEWFLDINSAINREKVLKGWKRFKKIKLIEKDNPMWKDLYGELNPI